MTALAGVDDLIEEICSSGGMNVTAQSRLSAAE
jgi:hypothetical protein